MLQLYIYTKTRNRWTMVKHHISQYPNFPSWKFFKRGLWKTNTNTNTWSIFDSPQDFFLLGMVWLLSNCKRIQDSSFQDVWFIEYHLPIHFYPKYPKKNGFVFSKVGIPSTDPKTRPRHVLFPGLLLRPDGFPLGSGDPFGRTVRWMGLRKQLQLISYNSVWKIKGALWSLCVLVWV